MFGAPTIFWIIYMFGIEISLSLKQCDDCIAIKDCYPGYNLHQEDTDETIMKIKNCACDFHLRNNKIQKIYVCCSNLKKTSLDELENHQNRILLPLATDCGQVWGNRISGGFRADLLEFPWMVILLSEDQSPTCSGSLINERYILTAAHCVIERKVFTARLGEYNLLKKPDCYPKQFNYCIEHVDLKISELTIHPLYERYPRVVNDIALVRLATPANFSYDNIKPICLPIPVNLRNKELYESTATIAGWGRTENRNHANELRKADTYVLNKTICDSYYINSSVNNQFCAGTGGKDTCTGDSGGPLMIEEIYYKKYNVVQYGIVSYGHTQCNGLTPGVYVDVRPYLKWILDSIKP